jgi:hypothetical protein
MPRRLLSFASAAVLLLSVSGCIVVTNPTSRGDVTFLWSFNGAICAVVPEVSQVTITIPGQTLQNSGVYGCTNSGVAGITLLNFAPGTYSYDIQGRNNVGAVIYAASGRFTVDGNVTVNVNLQPNVSATSSVYVTWTFPPNGISGTQPASCAQTVGPIGAVEVSIDGASPVAVTCAEGQTSPGARFDNLLVGSHTIDLLARGPDYGAPVGQSRDLYYFRKTSTLQVVAGTSASQQYALDWTVGGVAVKWSFNNGATQLNCAQAGVTTVYVNLRDSEGKFFPDTTGTGIAVPCLNQGVQGATLPSQFLSYVYAGNYQVFLQARGTGDVLYRSAQTPPPTVTVTAGVFPLVDGTTPTLVLGL